eukprot:10467741-Ditylum_brightwellii.AAC.1
MEVVGGVEVGCGLLRHMSDSPNAKHSTGGLKILVGNVMKKILVSISSTPKSIITQSADLLVHVDNVLSCIGG